jgi:NAD(P)-dependent dehydrogenase (short-subunit alcohol dehydrogenase family)
MKIKESVFLVTGGASGLGAGVARRLCSQGARVLVADLNESAGKALLTEFPQLRFVPCDVTQEAGVQRAVDEAIAAWGRLDALVNCAGVAPGEKVVGKEAPHALASFRRAIDINLVGTFNALRIAAQAMHAQQPNAEGERGVIICTASVAAFDGQIGQAAYSASKAGVVGMTLPIARELARHGIRVMTIAPGIFETPMLASLPPQVQESLAKTIPFPSRLGRPDEFAHLVQCIVENPMLNGEVIRLDGAIRMAPR